MKNLIESVPEFLKECIPNFESEKLDKSYISMGHGLGGTTAFQLGQSDPFKIKAVITLDPWLFPLKTQKALILPHPHCCITSEFFQSTEISQVRMQNGLLQNNWNLTK